MRASLLLAIAIGVVVSTQTFPYTISADMLANIALSAESIQADTGFGSKAASFNFDDKTPVAGSNINSSNNFFLLTFGDSMASIGRLTFRARAGKQEYVQTYRLQVTFDNASWVDVGAGKIYKGNSDATSASENIFVKPIVALALRVIPVSYFGGMSADIAVNFDSVALAAIPNPVKPAPAKPEVAIITDANQVPLPTIDNFDDSNYEQYDFDVWNNISLFRLKNVFHDSQRSLLEKIGGSAALDLYLNYFHILLVNDKHLGATFNALDVNKIKDSDKKFFEVLLGGGSAELRFKPLALNLFPENFYLSKSLYQRYMLLFVKALVDNNVSQENSYFAGRRLKKIIETMPTPDY